MGLCHLCVPGSKVHTAYHVKMQASSGCGSPAICVPPFSLHTLVSCTATTADADKQPPGGTQVHRAEGGVYISVSFEDSKNSG